jgi:hypothetical protein
MIMDDSLHWVSAGPEQWLSVQGRLSLFVARESRGWIFYATRPGHGRLHWLANAAELPTRGAAIAAAEAWWADLSGRAAALDRRPSAPRS